MRVPLVCVFGAVILAGCCAARSASTRAEPATAAVTTRPAQTPAAFALRPDDRWFETLLYQRLYLEKEGPTHRGSAFEHLMQSLAPSIHEEHVTRPVEPGEQNPNPVSELEVLLLAGPPGKYASGPWGAIMVYRYQIEGFILSLEAKPSRDWAAWLEFDEHGILTDVGYNDASVMMKQFAQANATTRDTDKGYLGIALEARAQNGNAGREIVLIIRRVVEGSSAERAGLHPGDVIAEVNGRPVGEDFPSMIRGLHPGDEVILTVHPSGDASAAAVHKVHVKVGRFPTMADRLTK